MAQSADVVKAVRNSVEDYEQTVAALVAFGAMVIFRQSTVADFGFGRRMTTSEANAVSPSADVTPDIVVQKTPEYGIVAEAKRSLNQERSRWSLHLEQLRKYDDALVGWWTEDEAIQHSDTVLLIHQSRARAFRNFLLEREAEIPGVVGPTSSIVEFNRSDEASPYMFFRREHGTLLDGELHGALEEGISVPLDEIKQSHPNVRYYDYRPPVALLLQRLWMDVFASQIGAIEKDENLGAFPISVSLTETTLELQRAYGSGQLSHDERSCEFPKISWIKEALSKLVELKLAIGPEEDGDSYLILFKSYRNKDILEHFIGLLHGRHRESSSIPEQIELRLFPESDTEED